MAVLGIFSNNSDLGDSGYTSGSSASTDERADLGTRMACERWRENLANASVETREQQIAGAQKVNEYARISTNPEIVSNARSMTEAFLVQDSEAYFAFGTAFGNACTADGA